MLVTNFLEDDFVQDGYIKEIPGQYLAMAFTFQPAIVTERAALMASFNGLSEEEVERLSASFMEKKLKGWDIKDRRGNPVARTAANILRLRPGLSQRMYRIIIGTEATDTNPTWSEPKKQEETTTKAQNIRDGRSPGEATEIRVGGN